MTPEISIVIPTINRYNDLKNTLNDLSKQSFKNFEIIVIDQTEENITQEITHEKTLHFLRSYKSASKARNEGLLLAKSPVLLYLDDDVLIKNKDFIKNHINHFKDKKVSGVAGAILDLNGKTTSKLPRNESRKHLGWLYFPRNYTKLYKVRGGGSGNLAVRKDWAIDVGGMDENYDKGAYREESDFCIRYTDKYGKLIFDPAADLVHIGSPTGGTREWKNSNGIVHAQQHMFGAWYFMFMQLPLISWPEYAYITTRRFILHKKLMIRFYLWPSAIYRFTTAFFMAIYTAIKGPVHINLSDDYYQ